ncbi:MAG TPA: hypothetical protein VGZ48_10575 [Candidatus Acidoferrales bacterium]|nr:hypothetical protein [Candidatus Acidoferrales bacterium]
MPDVLTTTDSSQVVIEIGGLPIRLSVDDPSFVDLLNNRYAGFVANSSRPRFEFQMDLAPSGLVNDDEDVRVRWDSGKWCLDRGDFHAEWNPSTGRGKVRQTANPYSIDCVLRIVHTLLLANDGGFLLHAASAVRNGRAFLFSGVSGAGKTTIAGLAPPDVSLLTDEISYVVNKSGQYFAFGTPFAGELARVGENLCAPIAEVFLLAQGGENKIEPLDSAVAARKLLRNTLFFAEDPALVNAVFHSVCEFVRRVPVHRLTFLPDAKVWELIQ